MLYKLCGLTRQEDLDCAAAAGVDFCGFIFHPKSPRHVTPEHAARLESHGMKRVGVFVNQEGREILAIARGARLDFIQLHGAQSRQTALELGPERIIRVFWPQKLKKGELQAMAHEWRDCCSLFLLDSGAAGGGSGKSLPWPDLENLRLPKPWLLAGGLGPANIREAVRLCNPDGVDINSGIELAPGIKEAESIREIKNLLTLKEKSE